MAQKTVLQNRPNVQYRVELEKKIQINKSYSERRNQAIAMRIISYGLFGQKRYQNIYLSCSLNCFYYGLKIANAIHRRVAGLAMIIRFEQAHVIEYYAEPFEGKTYGEKKYSKINIKLTKTPTKEDQQQPGYNPGLSVEDIEQPLTDVIERRQQPEGQRGRFNRRFTRGGRGSFRGGYQRPYGGYRDEGELRQRRQGRQYREGRQVRQNREGRQNRQGRQFRQRRETGVDYRQFKSNRYEQQSNLRGQRRTRGSYQREPNNDRNERPNYDDDKSFDRRRGYQERENRDARGPQRRRYDGQSD